MSVLSEDRYLADLQTKDQVQAAFLQRLVDAINNVSRGAGVSTFGDLTPPSPVNAITVKARGEMVHVTLSHAAELTRPINYWLEADTNPSFTQPHPIHLGASRTHVFTLPTFDDNGVPQKWYLRAFAQYPGSPPSRPTVLGSLTNPTAVQLQGLTKMTLMPSTGSGTASGTGQQGGNGFGKQRRSTQKVLRVGKSQASVAAVAAPNIATHLAKGSVPPILADSNPFTFATTTSSITFSWAAFNLYRPDGSIQAMVPSPTGGIAITGLSANTSYFFYPYYDELAQTIAFASGGAGSPSYAFTAQSTAAAQKQNLTTNVPLAMGSIKVTTPASGSGGGSGGGGSCFTPDVCLKTYFLPIRIGQAKKGNLILTGKGSIRPIKKIHVHDFDGLLLKIPDGGVSGNHLFRQGMGWERAQLLFNESFRYTGEIFSVEVESNEDEDIALSPFTEHSMILASGLVAHNFQPLK